MTFKFKENTTVTEDLASTVPAELKSFYTTGETEGSLTLRPEMQGAADAWDGMAETNEKTRAEIREAKKGKVDLSILSEYGSNPSDILSSFNDRTKEMSDAIEAKKGAVDPEKMRKQMTEGFTKKEASWTEEKKALKEQVYQLVVISELQKSVSKHKGDAHILLPILERQVSIDESTGRYLPVVLDSDGEQRRNGTGQLMTMDQLVESTKNDPAYKKLFDADVKKGSGPPANQVHRGVQPNAGVTSATEDIQAGLPD